MRSWILIGLMIPVMALGQQNEVSEQGVETLQEVVEATGNPELPLPDDESGLLLDLNTGDPAEILQSPLLTPAQAQGILRHRARFGRFLKVEELQVVDELDTMIIRRIRRFLQCGMPVVDSRFRPSAVLAAARHELTVRGRRNLGDKSGYSSDGNYPFYTGDPNQLYLRYKMTAGSHFSAGVVMEKDAGERFLDRSNGGRIDYFGWHVFFRPSTKVKMMAVGDYQVQFGQGLVAWNGISLGKSTEVHQVYRRGTGFRPYSSSGETGFYRGLALAIGNRRTTLHTWFSYRRLDASLFPVDTTFTLFEVSSIQQSGLHRTWEEISRKANLGQTVAGVHWQHEEKRWRHEMTAQYTGYEYPLWPGDDPYERFDFGGKAYISVGYSGRLLLPNGSAYTEIASDREGDIAYLGGIVLMTDKQFTISLQGRHYPRDFQSPGADALREGSKVQNEDGLFIGALWQLHQQFRVQGYLDLFRFPWLRYTTSAPVSGKEWLVQATYLPARTTEVYLRFRQEEKPSDVAGDRIKHPENMLHRNLRFNAQWMQGRNVEMNVRCEWVQQKGSGSRSDGILFYQECRYKPMGKPWSIAGRWSVFRTGGYDSRIYSYEQDMAGSFSLPAYYSSGMRYYLLLRYRLMKGLDVWLRYGVTSYEKPAGDVPSPEPSREIKTQIRWQF